MNNFKFPQRYKVTLKGGMEYTGYIAPCNITDKWDFETGTEREIQFALYSDEATLKGYVQSGDSTYHYKPKAIRLNDPSIDKIEEIESNIK